MTWLLLCLSDRHDAGLLALAVLLDGLAAGSSALLITHARNASGAEAKRWLAAAAVATGVGVWATHFVAMLAYIPAVPVGFEPAPTALSLVAGVLGAALGLRLALHGRPGIGGGVLGLGVVALHFIGMAGFAVPGRLTWDPGLVGVAVGCAVAFGSAALCVLLGERVREGWRRIGAGTVLVAIAVAGLHFTAMAALTISYDPLRLPSPDAVEPGFLGTLVAAGASLVLGLAIAALMVDRRSAARLAQRLQELASLADAAVEGLLIVEDTRVVAVNASFAELAGSSQEALSGQEVGPLFENGDLLARIDGANGPIGEAMLLGQHGPVPVALFAKPIQYAGRPHRVIAVRDLRSSLEAEARIRYLAHHDALTGLANRTAFSDRLDDWLHRSKGEGPGFSLLLLDLDRFKQINDTLGHPVGDQLLRRVAKRLRAACGPAAELARLGGDEFAVLSPHASASCQVEAETLARRIVELLGRPFLVDSHALSIGATLGIAPASGGPAGIPPAEGAAELIQRADLALYRAKALDRGSWRFFEAGMDAEARRRQLLERSLREAVARGEFVLHYQPKMDTRSRRITGYEALIRWYHPELGIIQPADFIPLAEETMTIIPLGEWALRQATLDAAARFGGSCVAVNLSPVQFRSANLVACVRDALAQSGLPACQLELEITESVLMQDGEATLAVLHELRTLGVHIAMDDFGTGYSSLSYLRSFPFDRIKIDQSFVREMTGNVESAAIVRAVLGLGRTLGIATTVEGVETLEQRALVEAEGCDELQGWLVGKPAPVDVAVKRSREADAA